MKKLFDKKEFDFSRLRGDMWLTPSCQQVVNDWNKGTLPEARAITLLQAVGKLRPRRGSSWSCTVGGVPRSRDRSPETPSGE